MASRILRNKSVSSWDEIRMQVWLIFVHVRSRFPLSYSFFSKDPESSSGYLTGFRITTRLNVSIVLYLLIVSHISVRPSSTSERIIHSCSIRSDCGSRVRATWSNHKTAKALDLPSITRTKTKNRFRPQVGNSEREHCVNLPHQRTGEFHE